MTLSRRQQKHRLKMRQVRQIRTMSLCTAMMGPWDIQDKWLVIRKKAHCPKFNLKKEKLSQWQWRQTSCISTWNVEYEFITKNQFHNWTSKLAHIWHILTIDYTLPRYYLKYLIGEELKHSKLLSFYNSNLTKICQGHQQKLNCKFTDAPIDF